MRLGLKNRNRTIILVIIVFSLILIKSLALNKGLIDEDQFPDPPIIEDINNTINGSIVNITQIYIPDIILESFYLDKNQTLINETVNGNFKINIINSTYQNFNAILTIDKSNYTEEFSINDSGEYIISQILFPSLDFFNVTIYLDPNNEINETDESNNQKSLMINVIIYNLTQINPINITNQTNTTQPIFNLTNTSNISNITNQTIISNQTNISSELKNNTNYSDLLTGNFIVDFNNYRPISKNKPSQRNNVYFNNNLIETFDNSENSELFYSEDLQNNIRIVTDIFGEVVQSKDYDPFGNEMEQINNAYNENGFSSKESDGSNLLYYGSRYYDSSIGRFTSTDKLLDVSESSYSYVSNNPLKYTDPDGNKKKLNNDNINQGIIKNPPQKDNGDIEAKRYLDVNGKNLNTKFLPAKLSQDMNSFDKARSAVGAVGVVLDLTQDYLYAFGLTPEQYDHQSLEWNSFWKKYIPSSSTFSITDSKSVWNDEISGITYHGLGSRPYRYEVTANDFIHALKNIQTEQDFNSFFYLMKVKRDEKTDHIVFGLLGKKPVSSEIEKLYNEMVLRVSDNSQPAFRAIPVKGDTIRDGAKR